MMRVVDVLYSVPFIFVVIFVITLIGGSLMEWLGRQAHGTWAVAAIVAAGIFVLNRRNRRRRTASNSNAESG